MIKKLIVMDLVDSKPYKPILLTSAGREKATEIIYKHRLIELYLVKKMKFKRNEVHDIAEEIEHIENSDFFKRMKEILGDTDIDPHGSKIPKYDYQQFKNTQRVISNATTGFSSDLARIK